MRLIVQQTSIDGLQQLTWTFWVYDDHRAIKAVLDEYTVAARPTMRHKFRNTSVWNRLTPRAHRYPGDGLMDAPPEVQEWVREDALKQIVAAITFVPIGAQL